MKNPIISPLAGLVAAALIILNPHSSFGQTVETMPPVVVKTVPEAGSKDVAPGEIEVRVTFSKDMTDRSWSCSDAWDHASAEVVGGPYFEADHRTWVIKVKLEPNKTYGYWINSQKYQSFRDAHGHAAVPYLLVFSTKGGR